jgi:hypothetical protein
MAYLTELVDHPIALLVAVVLSAPILWQLGKAWFPNVEEDIKEAAPFAVIDALGGPTVATWPLVKLVWFVIVSAAILVTFYKIGAWVSEW